MFWLKNQFRAKESFLIKRYTPLLQDKDREEKKIK
jgi:hypothetical protein